MHANVTNTECTRQRENKLNLQEVPYYMNDCIDQTGTDGICMSVCHAGKVSLEVAIKNLG